MLFYNFDELTVTINVAQNKNIKNKKNIYLYFVGKASYYIAHFIHTGNLKCLKNKNNKIV